MSSRYSLRSTPRKKEPFEGMVETPSRRSTRRKSRMQSIESSDDGDSSSAVETTTAMSRMPKTTAQRRRAPESEESDGNVKNNQPSEIRTRKVAATTSGNADGTVNGNANGSANGTANGHASGNSNGHAAPKEDKLIDGWKPGMDHRIDYSGRVEFGGSFGTLGLMIGFPLLMWYMWLGATQYDGKLPLPQEGQSLVDFLQHLLHLVYTRAFPTLQAWKIYWGYMIFEGICYYFLPGVEGYGKPLPFEGGKQLRYFCNAYASFYFTILVMGILHFTGYFPIYTFIDEFGPILTVAILSGYIVSFVAYFSALARGRQHRMTGYPIYDFFMGAELNPRMFGIIDMKMFYEVRIPWYILFGISTATAARQYEQYGYVAGEVWFLVMAHYLYANACSKGEQLIITTWDMYYEKWGFMLIFWNMAGVPLSYCHCTLYLASHDPSEYAWNKLALTALFIAYIGVYVVWDQCNAQKNAFRAKERGTLLKRKTFPTLPWTYLDNPKTIDTDTGDKLLVDGWYGYARKIHYTCDAFFAISWGLITGFNSPFPWFYPVFFVGMITHRTMRDIERCRTKYGEAWNEYERRVPYLFIPYVI
ncbi:Delta(24(24(1)))-sterol reductase [Xylaria intraflava]|nr:Delta(24(24(1)))-sterol reductase [Xylaria intraflava]